MSHENASLIPPPKAGPLIHTIVTLLKLSISSNKLFSSLKMPKLTSPPLLTTRAAWLRSMLVQKNLPFALIIIRDMDRSFSNVLKAAWKSSIIRDVRGLPLRGVLRTILPIAPDRYISRRLVARTSDQSNLFVNSRDASLEAVIPLDAFFIDRATLALLLFDFESTFEIHTPVSASFCRLTLVLTPAFSNRYTTSSVATLPLAPGAKGQPPKPPTLLSNVRTPHS